MVHLYLTRFESVFRILHVPSFWREYDDYWSDPGATETVIRLKILLTIAIGSSVHEDSTSYGDIHLEAHQWLYEAQEWLSGPLRKDRITIGGLQVQCLLILARQTLAVGGDLVWISLGTVTRTAIQMGLHRDPKHFQKMSAL